MTDPKPGPIQPPTVEWWDMLDEVADLPEQERQKALHAHRDFLMTPTGEFVESPL